MNIVIFQTTKPFDRNYISCFRKTLKLTYCKVETQHFSGVLPDPRIREGERGPCTSLLPQAPQTLTPPLTRTLTDLRRVVISSVGVFAPAVISRCQWAYTAFLASRFFDTYTGSFTSDLCQVNDNVARILLLDL